MSNLDTFAKVRALHDGTTDPGEKAAAAVKMKTLARKAGMTVAEAVSKLDAPKPAAPRTIFDDLFNSPDARAQKAERERERAERCAEALAEYGSEDAVWAPCERERALAEACRPFIVRKPIINGEIDTLQGWDGGLGLPPEARAAVSTGYPLPTTVRGVWDEYRYWDRRQDAQEAFFEYADFPLVVRDRREVLEGLLDTLPARSADDVHARLDWMQHILDLGFSRDVREDTTTLITLRADIERLGCGFGEPAAAPVQDGQGTEADRSAPASAQPVQSGQPRRTNADKRRDVLALLGQDLADREVARRAGVSPTTVGAIRKSLP